MLMRGLFFFFEAFDNLIFSESVASFRNSCASSASAGAAAEFPVFVFSELAELPKLPVKAGVCYPEEEEL